MRSELAINSYFISRHADDVLRICSDTTIMMRPKEYSPLASGRSSRAGILVSQVLGLKMARNEISGSLF